VGSSKRRRRPRPVLTLFRPHSLQNDMGLDYKTEGQGLLSRKTLLPLPATKLPKVGTNATTANAPSTFPKALVQAAAEPILLAEPRTVEKTNTIWYGHAKAVGPNPSQDTTGATEGVKLAATNKRSTATNPGLSSPPLLLPPSTRQRLETKLSSRLHETHDRPLSAASTLSDELFSDIDESMIRTPFRGLDRSPERKDTQLVSQHTPQSKHQLPSEVYEDNEKTPRPSVYTSPSKQSKSFGSPPLDDTEHLAEQVTVATLAAHLMLLI